MSASLRTRFAKNTPWRASPSSLKPAPGSPNEKTEGVDPADPKRRQWPARDRNRRPRPPSPASRLTPERQPRRRIPRYQKSQPVPELRQPPRQLQNAPPDRPVVEAEIHAVPRQDGAPREVVDGRPDKSYQRERISSISSGDAGRTFIFALSGISTWGFSS